MRRLLVPFVLAALLFGAACGNDDEPEETSLSEEADQDATEDEAADDEASTSDDEATTDDGADDGATDDAPAAEGAERFCQISQELEDVEDPTEELGENATPEEIEQALRDSFRELGGSIGELRDAAPEEIRADVDTLIDAIQRFIEGGTLEELSADTEVTAASDRLDQFEQENCPS